MAFCIRAPSLSRLSPSTRSVAPSRSLGQPRPFVHHRYRSFSSPSSASASASSPPPPPAGRSLLSTLVLGSAVLVIATTAYVAGAVRPPQLLRLINPPIAPPSPAPDSPEGIAATQRIEAGLSELEEVKRLRQRIGSESASESEGWYESRPYVNYQEERRRHQLTAGSLRGPGKLAVPPLVFSKRDESESIIFVHAGRSLCGHDGIVHGGLLATLCDEGLARTAILSLPNHVGMTAYLNVSYKAPTMADQYLVMRTWLPKPPQGRKAWAEGRLETLDGQLLLTAEALFIEPRCAAALLDKKAVAEILGKPNT